MIEAKGLTKRYKDFTALNNLNLNIGEGQIFGYIGPNGAGKSTTIKSFCGLLTPSAGSGKLAGFDIVKDAAKVRAVVGYMPDAFGVYDEMRVWEYLDFFGAAYKLNKKARKKRIEELLELAGIEYMRDYYVDSLSKGMKQKVGLAKTLIHDPKVLFLDEPMSGLDPRARIEMRTMLKTLRSMGKTIMISSHILPELADISDTIGIIEHGNLLACGTVEEVMKSVRQTRVIDIEVQGGTARAAKVLEALKAKGFLQKIIEMEKIVRIETDQQDQAMATILRTLVSNKVVVVWFSEVESDLEEVFMSVTKAASGRGGDDSSRMAADGDEEVVEAEEDGVDESEVEEGE